MSSLPGYHASMQGINNRTLCNHALGFLGPHGLHQVGQFTTGVPSKPDTEPAVTGHSMLHEPGQETHDISVILPSDVLQECTTSDIAPLVVLEVAPVNNEVPQGKAKASHGGYGMACQTCKKDKTRYKRDIDGEPYNQYWHARATEGCPQWAGEEQCEKKGAGLVRPEERKKKQEGVKEAAHAQTQGGKSKEKA
ncbi:hypothetical protein OBBRIDRAFT_856819 [Obba rivulosa]|uniref:Uncharacterized protein n=1 Tax=Obba rivulosa TaxID=1052685 RepID=A0A8E2AQ86_9APHY|nr:hypothetical protein OBBRIDRAFT_856819 [Obba rivulosa]